MKTDSTLQNVHPDTLTATALGWIDPATDAMAMPWRPSTSFLRDPQELDRCGRSFTRDDNPTYVQAEALINQLEGGSGCLLYSSGMAAIISVFQRLQPGDHIVVPRLVYSGLRDWLNVHGIRWGLQVSYLNDCQPTSLNSSVQPGKTKIVWLETPSNPTWEITDIAAAAEVAHAAGALIVIDNTVPTPILTQPIKFGADIVVHSCSKYMNGHGDLIAGALVTAPQHEQILSDLGSLRNHYGGVLGSFEAWLLLRGMRTLSVRVRTASENAATVARYLDSCKEVEEVLYPGLASHAAHAIAVKQMQGGFGGMLSFRIKGGEQAAISFAGRLKVFRQAISFGSTESVIEHRAGMENPDTPTPRDLLRVSIGLEHVQDLIDDLKQAFAAPVNGM